MAAAPAAVYRRVNCGDYCRSGGVKKKICRASNEGGGLPQAYHIIYIFSAPREDIPATDTTEEEERKLKYLAK